MFSDLLERIKTIFKDKKVPLDSIYSLISILMKLSFNPINNPINIEYLRENFENRCITCQKQRIVRNANLNPLIIYDQEKSFNEEKWKYLQEESMEVDLSEDEEKIIQVEKRNEIEEKMDIIWEDKNIMKRKLNLNKNFDLEKKCFLFKKLYPSLYNETDMRIYLHMIQINSRFSIKKLKKFSDLYTKIDKSKFISQTFNSNNVISGLNDKRKLCINTEFIINSLLLSFRNLKGSLISSISDLKNYCLVDVNQLIINELLEELFPYIEKIDFLRKFEVKLDELKFKSNLKQSINFFVKDFLVFFDLVISNFSKVFNYQLGKISRSQLINDQKFHIEKVLNDNFKYTKILFEQLINQHKSYLADLNHLRIIRKYNLN